MRSVVQLCLAIAVFSIPALAADGDGQGSMAAAAHQRFIQKNIIARWNVTTKTSLQTALAKGVDVLEEAPDLSKGHFTVLVSQAELNELQAEGHKIDVLNHDWYDTFAAKAMSPNGGFRTLFQAVVKMDSIHTAHPSITTARFSIGQTVEGRDIWAMKISDNPDTDEDEPELLFNALHHSREPVTMDVLLETMSRLTEGYGVDTRITDLVNEREIWFIPCINADGYEYNTDNFPNGGGMWRKNRRNNGDGTFGVDLNRNYGHEWGYDNIGSSPSTSSETYRGPSAFSEPETQAMRAFVNSREFVFMINFHSHGDWYLFPWGYEPILTPDHALFSAIGDSLATYNGYKPAAGVNFLYPTNGDTDDWAYGATGEHDRILSYTPEVGPAFWPPESEIPTLIDENQEPNLILIDLAANPDRIFPAATPVWTTPDTVPSGNFDASWTDPGGSNPAVSFSLYELEGAFVKVDDAESFPAADWDLGGFTWSTARSSSGTHSYFGGAQSQTIRRMTATEFYVVQPNDSLVFQTWYDIEVDWDYAYAEISTDGGETFATLPGNVTTNTNPNGNNRGNGITGASGGFVAAKFPLSAYVGENALFRLAYETDQAVLEEGFYADDIAPLQAYATTTTLVTDQPGTTFSVTGKSNGDYSYRVSAKDADDQTSALGLVHRVTVAVPSNGDMNDNGFIDAVDLNALIDFVFFSGPPAQIPGAEECNGFAGVNVLDIVHLIDYVFRGGSAPVGL